MTPPRRWWAWACRLALTLVFVLGTLASAGGKASEAEAEGEGESERIVECGEEGEPLSGCGPSARVVRRPTPSRAAPYGRSLAAVRAPARLDPAAPEPPGPSWRRPRRVPPDDEDATG